MHLIICNRDATTLVDRANRQPNSQTSAKPQPNVSQTSANRQPSTNNRPNTCIFIICNRGATKLADRANHQPISQTSAKRQPTVSLQPIIDLTLAALSFAIMMPQSCDLCLKSFSHRQSLFKHKKKKKKCTPPPSKPTAPIETKSETRLIPILSKRPKLSMDDDNEINAPSDIPTFDGAEFSGDKPKSEKTLIKIMDMLKIPRENRAQILKSVRNNKQDGRSPTPPSRGNIPHHHLSAGEKTLLNDFSRLFQEMKMTSKDNGKELTDILNELRNSESVDEECYQTAFKAVEDLCNKSVL